MHSVVARALASTPCSGGRHTRLAPCQAVPFAKRQVYGYLPATRVVGCLLSLRASHAGRTSSARSAESDRPRSLHRSAPDGKQSALGPIALPWGCAAVSRSDTPGAGKGPSFLTRSAPRNSQNRRATLSKARDAGVALASGRAPEHLHALAWGLHFPILSTASASCRTPGRDAAEPEKPIKADT